MSGNKYVANKIKLIRKSKGFTQAELANKIGKTESSVQKYENGITEIPISVLIKIANILDTTVLELFETPEAIHRMEDVAKVSDYVIQPGELEHELLDTFWKLNNEGQSEAIKRITELTEIKRYTE